jgi:hypothetical protein
MSNKAEVLAARVRIVNRAHTVANELAAVLKQRFAPLVGKKVEKAGGQILEKYKNLLPEMPNDHNLMVYKHASNYSLAWTVKASETVPVQGHGHAYYYEVTFYVGDMQGDVLTGITKHETAFRTDWTVEEVLGNREAFKVAQKAFEEARSALYPFGEYDR